MSATGRLESERVPAPKTLTGVERQKRYRTNNHLSDTAYNASVKGRTRRTKYRHDNSKHDTDTAYLSRPIIAWDGEGVTRKRHDYVMIAGMSSIDMAYRSIVDADGIGTVRIFDFLLEVASDTPKALNVIYGGGYDFNMWLKDLSRWDVERIYRYPFHVWNGYRIGWRSGKCFYLKRLDDSASVTIYDVVSFFQCPFVKACDEYLGDRFEGREEIVENKALRSSFTTADIDRVGKYNELELRNLLSLVSELRSRLNKVGLRPKRWDGPGAIAAALMQRESVKDAQRDCPPEVAEAARYAYAGGRFEVIKFGNVEDKAYEYDVNSAYPAALRSVPNLNHGKWVHHADGKAVLEQESWRESFTVFHVRWDADDMEIPGPLFRRNYNGSICYPLTGIGWYWTPEIAALVDYAASNYGRYELLEAWQFVPEPGYPKPFAFIEPLYNKRRALKKAKDGAHVGIKLGLNSLYGKLAQQVGWRLDKKGNLHIPPFHQLEWAGYVTSYCRAKVLSAALLDMDSVIAFETDAVFTSRPLPVPVSSNLGEFEETRFDSLAYIQSGLYFGIKDTGEEVNKTRGVDRGELTREFVLQRLSQRRSDDRYAEAKLTRFVGAGIALSQSWQRWRSWEVMTKRISLEPQGKRMHTECDACGTDHRIISFGQWHTTMCPQLDVRHSAEFPIEWINPDPEMVALDEMRREPTDWDDAT